MYNTHPIRLLVELLVVASVTRMCNNHSAIIMPTHHIHAFFVFQGTPMFILVIPFLGAFTRIAFLLHHAAFTDIQTLFRMLDTNLFCLFVVKHLLVCSFVAFIANDWCVRLFRASKYIQTMVGVSRLNISIFRCFIHLIP